MFLLQLCQTQECERWGEFGEWSNCSRTCGGGVRIATRRCINGEPGQRGCRGNTTREETCNSSESFVCCKHSKLHVESHQPIASSFEMKSLHYTISLSSALFQAGKSYNVPLLKITKCTILQQ